MSNHTDEDRHFKEWITAVNRLIYGRFQLTLDDLPDMMTRSAFDDGVEPKEFFENDVMDLMREEFGPFVDAMGTDE